MVTFYKERDRVGLETREKTSVCKPDIIVFDQPEQIDQYAADRVINQIQKKPNSVLTLPTGSTPEGMYKKLVDAYRQRKVSFKDATVINLDEYWPLDPNHPASYSTYMKKNFIDLVDIPLEKWHIPNSRAPDRNQEAARFERLFEEAGGVDLAVLGIGPGTTCHIGFNERGSAVNSRVRYVSLDPQTAMENSKKFPNPEDIPAGTITQGVANILEAEKIILLAKGVIKAKGVHLALEGPIGSDAPASFLRYHPNTTFVLDADAASKLKSS